MNQPINARTVLVILLAIIFIAANIYLFIGLIKPVNADRAMKSQEIESEEKMIEQLELRIAQLLDGPIFTSTDLQRSVPVKPLVDQFILDLERAEVISDSVILDFSFNTQGFTGIGIEEEGEDGVENETATENEEANGEQEEADGEETDEEQPAPPVSNLPDGVERVTVDLEVYSPSYEKMLEFLKEIEKQTRVKKVDALNFTGDPEVTVIDENDEESEGFNYTVTISVFYLPDLQEFIDELPKINYPRPANKDNPLYNN